MKKKFFWAAALMAPLVVNSQCRVTELGGAQGGSITTAVALDKSGNAMTLSPAGVASIWGSDGVVKATAPVGRASLRPFVYSMNDKGQALIGADTCTSARPNYSTSLAIWNWRTAEVKCLKNLPFEMDSYFRGNGYSKTVLNNKGWVYVNAEDRANKYRAVAFPPNRSGFELPYHSNSTAEYVNGGNTSGWVVGARGDYYSSPEARPAAWKDQVAIGDTISWPTEYGYISAVASNGDMVGKAMSYPYDSYGYGIFLTNEGKDWQYLPEDFSPAHINSLGQIVGRQGTETLAIYVKGKSVDLSQRMPAGWHEGGRRLTDVKGLNDKSQILAMYEMSSPTGTSTGAMLLSGCFGAKP